MNNQFYSAWMYTNDSSNVMMKKNNLIGLIKNYVESYVTPSDVVLIISLDN